MWAVEVDGWGKGGPVTIYEKHDVYIECTHGREYSFMTESDDEAVAAVNKIIESSSLSTFLTLPAEYRGMRQLVKREAIVGIVIKERPR